MGTKIFAAALLASALPLCAHAAPAPAADAASRTILSDVRKAMLARPLASISSIHASGTAEAVGIRTATEEWDDVKGLRFATRQTGGPIAGASGWDGTSAWNEDYAGLVTIDGGESGRLQAIDQAYLDNVAYLRPDYGGAAIHSLGKKSDGGMTYDVLAVTPPQGSELELWSDPRSHLIARVTTTVGIVSVVTQLSDYRKVDGITYPFHNVTKTSDGNTFTQSTSSVHVNEDVAAQMRAPVSNVHDFSIAGSDSTTVPMDVINNHIYVHLMLNGKGPYTFILDTGGDSIVTPEVAVALHAQTSGSAQIGGVGTATEAAGFTRVASIDIGKASIRNQYMLVLPIATGFGIAEGVHIDGMIGYQTVARFLTTIDYGNSTLTLQMPASQPASIPGASAMKFYFDRTIPRIPITVDGVATTGEVDTGSRAGLTLSAPFVAAHPAIAAQAKSADGVAGFGVGGPSFARLGRLNAQIGPFALSDTVADFTTAQKGAFADPFNPANLGGAIWRRFTVTFDYAHQQMLLAKNSAFGTPFGYDRSGLFLIDNKGAYTVIDARPGTPAASEHLAKGDVIVSVNGAPAANQSLAQLRALLSHAPGTVVHLHVRGPAGERDVALTLADYV